MNSTEFMAVLMDSDFDFGSMRKTLQLLEKFEFHHDFNVTSAYRSAAATLADAKDTALPECLLKA